VVAPVIAAAVLGPGLGFSTLYGVAAVVTVLGWWLVVNIRAVA